jgi:AcrR family transcriptional regulator
MEAASARIVDAMRRSVAARGAPASTFDHVAREAGVSRGLLHYYFGTKEKLLAEVVRRDCDIRMARFEAQLAEARTAADVIDVMVHSLEDLVERDPGFVALLFELFTSSRRNPEIAAELAELHRRTRDGVAELLARKQEEGVVRLGAEPEGVAAVLLSLGDGLALRMLAEPGHDHRPALRAGVVAAEALIAKP